MGLAPDAIQRMREAIGDDDEVLADILKSFADEVDGLVATLQTAAADGNMKSLRQTSHTLKSSCRDLGDAAIADLCATVEAEARLGEVPDAARKAADVAAGCLALKAEVQAFIAGLAA